MIIPFNQYLHESKESNWEQFADLLADNGLAIEDMPWKDDVLYAFYEVTLHCTLDTETGAITILTLDGGDKRNYLTNMEHHVRNLLNLLDELDSEDDRD
jgi:hypothetical protein